MIARGLLDRGAEVVILDEASSGLDPVAEFELVKSIKELGRNALVVVVSHRLSSIAEADRVLVMDHGRIVEKGRPTDLLESGGRCSDMFNVQARALGLSRSTPAP
jgi:ATP-binding cassette, subfamily B, bacterial